MPYLILLLAFTAGCTTMDFGREEEFVEGESERTYAITGCPTGQWCIESPATSGAPKLRGVFAVNPGDVFAVGDSGTILRRTSGAWRPMVSGTSATLRAVWAASSSDVWVGGSQGTVLHFNGTSWSPVFGAGSPDIDAVWGSGPDDVWFVGGSRVVHWDGTSLTQIGLTGTLLGVHGTGPDDVWVTGESTFLQRFDGSTWTVINPGAGSTMWTVAVLAPNDVWVTSPTPMKETLRFTTKWAPKPVFGVQFRSLSALGTNDIWGAGGRVVGHWNGTSWSTEQPFNGVSVWSITATTGVAWVVGDTSLISYTTF
jgi:hypothetical protein